MPVAELAVGLAALEWVASPVVKDLVNKGILYLGSDIAKGLEDLETILLPQFQLTIQAAQNSPDKDKLAKWLARLKNAYYDAEGILHELEYKRLKRKAKGDGKKLRVCISSHPIIKPFKKFTNKVNKTASPVMKPLTDLTRKVCQHVSLLSPQKKRLRDQLNKLKEIAAEAMEFHELLGGQPENENGASTSNTPSDTTSHLNHKVFGRDNVRDKIINFLLDKQGASSSRMSYSVVAITGMRGAGKTTLAQYVYNDERVVKHFGVRMWLCLSENKEVKERTRELIECASGEECPNLLNLNVLRNKLIEILPRSKSILLVLDDIWYDTVRERQWDDLLAPFGSIGARCKILVTSCQTLFPNALQPGMLIPLSDLAPDDFKSLFRYYAIDGLNISDIQLKNDLCDIGDQIATRMSQSPLAAKVVGNQLQRQPNRAFWRATQENVNLSSTREVLLWSYQHFDVQLKRCYLFCSVFPKGKWFATGNDLVQYWVALDFIQSSDDNRNIDDIGIDYFNMMVANSIFQLVNGKYFMHELFRDLAEKLSTGDCFRVTNFEQEIPSTTLYAFLKVNNENLEKNLLSICNSRNLRALILDIPFNTVEDVSEVFSIITTNFKNLRVLDIWSGGYRKLPSVVGDLRNLRYLNVWASSIEKLPDSVLQLYHLQFLILPLSIKTLPTKLSDLIKLRSIGKYDTNFDLLNSLPPVPYIGKLTSLQSLGEFHVRKEEGYELQQLGSLREIAGSLRIVNLNNVSQKDGSIEARLIEDKPKLKKLELVWAQSSETNSDLEVIETLKPAAYLEDLLIEGYRDSSYPSWLLEDLFLNNIKYLKFYNCSALTVLPQNFHQSCHYLTELRVRKCPCLIYVCENDLQLYRNRGANYRLLDPYYPEADMKDLLHHEFKSFEQTGSVESCPEQLQIIENAAKDSALELSGDVKIAWWHCHQQRINFMFSRTTQANKLILPSMLRVLEISFCCISDGALSDCLRGMAVLEELYLEGIMTITTLPPTKVMKSLQSLRVLEIRSCWCLISLGGLNAVPNLEKFKVTSCRDMKIYHPGLRNIFFSVSLVYIFLVILNYWYPLNFGHA